MPSLAVLQADPIVVDIAIANYTYGKAYNCSYFDLVAQEWVVDGEVYNMTENDDGYSAILTCAFTHLTDLGGVVGPAPSMNKLAFDKLFSADFLMNNPLGFAIALSMLVAIVLAFWCSFRGYFAELEEEGAQIDHAKIMRTAHALSQTDYKVDKVSLSTRIVVKLRTEWDWAALVAPMPGDPFSRAQRLMVVLCGLLVTLFFEILFFKDPSNAVKFCEGEGSQEECFTYECLSTPAEKECDSARLSEVCDDIEDCIIFTSNGYIAVLLGALMSMPFAKLLGYTFGWLKEPYESVLDGEGAGGSGRIARCWRRITKGPAYSIEIATMGLAAEDRDDQAIAALEKLLAKGKIFRAANLSAEDRRALASVVEYHKVQEETYVEEEGDVGKYVYSIIRGTVERRVAGPNGGATARSVLTKGDFFGERALRHVRVREASWQAMNDEIELFKFDSTSVSLELAARLLDGAQAHLEEVAAAKAGKMAKRGRGKLRQVVKSQTKIRQTGRNAGAAAARRGPHSPETAAAQRLEWALSQLQGGSGSTTRRSLTSTEDVDSNELHPQDELRRLAPIRPLPEIPQPKEVARPTTPEGRALAWGAEGADGPAEQRMNRSQAESPDLDDDDEVRGTETAALVAEPVAEPMAEPMAEEDCEDKPDMAAMVAVAGGLGTVISASPLPRRATRRPRPPNIWKENAAQAEGDLSGGGVPGMVSDGNGLGGGQRPGTAGWVLGELAHASLAERQVAFGSDEAALVCSDEEDEEDDGEQGVLSARRRLTVVCANGLRNADRVFGGKSDPYAVVYWGGRRVGQTKVAKDTLDPRWRATFMLDNLDLLDEQAKAEAQANASKEFPPFAEADLLPLQARMQTAYGAGDTELAAELETELAELAEAVKKAAEEKAARAAAVDVLNIQLFDHDFDRDDLLGELTVPILRLAVDGSPCELAERSYPVVDAPPRLGKRKKKQQATGSLTISLSAADDSARGKRKSRKRRTPLHNAAHQGDHRLLLRLLEDRDPFDSKSKGGWEPALDDKEPELGWTALHYAVARGDKRCVRVLLQFDCEVGERSRDDAGWTPLHEAAWSGRAKSLRWLLAAGAPIDVQDKDGWTPLHAAGYQGHFGCATALLERQADRVLPDNSGQSPVELAAQRGHAGLSNLMLFGVHFGRRRGKCSAFSVYCQAFLVALACVVLIAATTAAFTLDKTAKWLMATAAALFFSMMVVEPLRIIMLGASPGTQTQHTSLCVLFQLMC